ncbi:MAG TPA: FecR domain-containing protein [Stenotrophomonas sp.]
MRPPSSSVQPENPVAQQARDWLLRLASGTMGEPDMQAFEQWLSQSGHRHAFEHERVLWRSLAARPQTTVVVQRPVRRTQRRWLAAVAVLALFCGVMSAPEMALRMRADYRSDVAIRHVSLPDGSTAVLDAGAAIAVHYGEATRRIELLRGRAWFEVVPQADAPFRITVGDGVVEDISTAFVVSRDGDRVDTAVEQGRVRVAARPDQGWMYLQAGQAAGWGKGGVAERGAELAPDHVAAWRRGELLLENAAVTQVLAELQRYRSGHVFVRGDLSALPPINAALRLDQPEQALDALAAGSGLSVTRLPFGIAIVQARQNELPARR